MCFHLFSQLKLSSPQSSHRKCRHRMWKSKPWQTLTPLSEIVEASPHLSGQSQADRRAAVNLPASFGCGYLSGYVHPPHLPELQSTTPLTTHLPSPCNLSLSNKLMENLVCLLWLIHSTEWHSTSGLRSKAMKHMQRLSLSKHNIWKVNIRGGRYF